MCYEATNGAGGCNGHGHEHGHASEDKPPGLRLGAGKGQVIELVRGLPARRVDQMIGHFFRMEDISGYVAGFYLMDMAERGDYGLFSAASIIEYGKKRFQREGSTIKDRIRIARALEGLPRLRQAFHKSKIGSSKISEIVKVATVENEAEWLEFAREKTVREIAHAVRGKEKGAKPPKKGDLGTPRRYCRIRIDVPIAFKALWDRFVEKRLCALGPGAKPLDVLREIVEKWDPDQDPKNIPDVVFHVNAKGESWFDSDEGRVPVALEDVLLLARGGRALRIRDPEKGEYPAITFGEHGSVPPAERADPTPAAIREAVLKRDGHRCVLCGSRKDPRVHHLDCRANGGEARIERMVTLCLVHHSLVHEGVIRLGIDATGKAYATDLEGRDLSVEVTPEEILEDAPEPYGMITLETSDPEPGPEIPEEVDQEARRLASVGKVEDDAEARRLATEVVVPQGSLHAVETAESLEEIPPSLTREEWHALSGRLEARARGELVFRPERDAAPPRAPEAPKKSGEGRKLSDLIGQDRVREHLGDLVQAAGSFGEPLPHMLFEGPAGLGKSSFARAMAAEMGVGIQVLLGSALGDPKEVAAYLTGLGRGDVLFIDEIHAAEKKTLESLYTALQERAFQQAVRQGSRSRSFEVALEPFTLMGATTEGGALPEPLRSRFSQVVRLEPYSEAEMVEIAKVHAARLSISMTPEASLELARRARGTPRLLENFIQSVRAHAVARKRPGIDLASVLEVMEVQGIDEEGLDRQEREILRYLLEVGRPIGLKAVAAALRMDVRTIERVHEPYLIEKRFLIRTARGRVATEKGREHIAQTRS